MGSYTSSRCDGIDLEDIITNGPEYNIIFANTYSNNIDVQECILVASTLNVNDITALKTSCVVTALMLRWKLSGTYDWNTVIDNDENMSKICEPNFFQIIFASDFVCTSYEHIVTIYDGYAIQSYFNKSTIKKNASQIDPSEIFKIDKIDLWKLLVDDRLPYNNDFVVMVIMP